LTVRELRRCSKTFDIEELGAINPTETTHQYVVVEALVWRVKRLDQCIVIVIVIVVVVKQTLIAIDEFVSSTFLSFLQTPSFSLSEFPILKLKE
jgi:hypothetical protein